MDGLVRWLAEKAVGLLGELMDFLASSLFTSPDVTLLPQVQSIAGKSALVVNGCFVLAIIAVGVAVMLGDSVTMQQGAKELIPRLVIGFILSVFAVPLTGVLIGVANALTVSMLGTSSPTNEMVPFVQVRIAAALTDGPSALMAAVTGLLIVVLMFMLIVSWLVRIGVLVLLAGIAPVALACYAVPWTQAAADLWWRSLLGCLATPTLQAVAFSTGVDLLIDPEANLPVRLGEQGSDMTNLLLVIVVLWITVRIPGLVGRFVTRQSGGPNVTGLILRTVTVQSLTRGLKGGR